ncbi:ATP-binding protein [Ileibacterium valens]|uniref:ATP-binding protein n=1 Tax=Ileibacterium valens TaxID=1862668 RepID=UPI00259B86C1|nr:ATP-binding protein [Ileibacterium valens]
MIIDRPDYIEKIHEFKDTKIIKILTGLRRSGKSTLLKLIQKKLINAGISKDRIIEINMELIENEPLKDYHTLNEYILERLNGSDRTYLFIDEIQEVESFEKLLSSLLLREDLDIYVTGSNSKMLSGELSTLLSGRYVEIPVYPFSYPEYLQMLQSVSSDHPASLNDWLVRGGLPYSIGFSEQAWTTYMEGIYNTVLIKDVIQRKKITDAALLESLSQYLADNISNPVTSTGIAHYLISSGKKTTSKTIDSYLEAMSDAFLVYPVCRFDLRGKKIFDRNQKYYFGDTGLRQYLIGNHLRDFGRLLENAVFLELRRRGYRVYTGRLNQEEVDFVAVKGTQIHYYQVSASILDEKTREREFKALERIQDNYPKTILSLDQFDFSQGGIQHQNLQDFFQESK